MRTIHNFGHDEARDVVLSMIEVSILLRLMKRSELDADERTLRDQMNEVLYGD